MGRMVRKQVYIELEQDALLKKRARDLGVTESDLIRRGINQFGQSAVNWPLDRQSWQDELTFIRQRALVPALDRRRAWTREELYEERFRRRAR
jgi:transposase-like protein